MAFVAALPSRAPYPRDGGTMETTRILGQISRRKSNLFCRSVHAVVERLEQRCLLSSWSQLSLPSGVAAGQSFLLPNGDVMFQESYNSISGTEAWYELVPDSKGNYSDATVVQLATSTKDFVDGF